MYFTNNPCDLDRNPDLVSSRVSDRATDRATNKTKNLTFLAKIMLILISHIYSQCEINLKINHTT